MPESRSLAQRWVEFAGFVKEVYGRFGEDRIALSAGAIAFFTLLSLVPLLLLAVTFAAPQLRELLTSLQSTLGPLYGLLNDQIGYLSDPTTRIVSIPAALVIGMWSGSSIFLIIESAINLAWHAQMKRPFWMRRLIAFLMVLIAGIFMMGAAFLTNIVAFLSQLDLAFFGHKAAELSWLIRTIVTFVIPVLLISSLFAVIYRVVPTRRVTFRSVIPGALFSGILWVCALHLLSLYWYTYGAAARTKLIYGSLTGIFLLMILLYYGALIFLFGGEISVVYHRRLVEAGDKEERLVEEGEQLSEEVMEHRRELARQENADRALAYYGYQGEEWRVTETREGKTKTQTPPQ